MEWRTALSLKSLIYLDIMTRLVIGIDRYRQVRSLELANSLINSSNKMVKYQRGGGAELAGLHLRLVSKTAYVKWNRLSYKYYTQMLNRDYVKEQLYLKK